MNNRLVNSLYTKIKSIYTKNRFINLFLSRNIFLRIFVFYAIINLKRLSSKCKNLEEYVDLAKSFEYSIFKDSPIFLIHSMQRKLEILKFIKLLKIIRPKIVLEIGTAFGGTLFLLSKFSNSDALLISIDLPEGQFGRGYSSLQRSFYKSFASNNQKIVIIRNNSHSSSTLRIVKKILNTKKIDVLFIDGDHTYEGVKKDFKMYSPLVKKNGIVAFHDIVKVPPEIELNCEVDKFWKEIKEKYEYIEFIEDWNQNWGGIGIIKIEK